MKVWFITGASRGFGALIAEKALEAGDAVVATARNPKHIVERLGEHERLLSVALDVTHEQQAQAAVNLALQRFGRIDILVNNAGYGLLGAVEEASAEEVEKIFKTNVFGLLSVTRAVLLQMRTQKSGHVMNISSIGGYRASLGWGVYCSTKFAVEALSEALFHELKPLNIKVTVIEPGYFRTDFLDRQSLSSTGRQIDDYAPTVGEMRKFAAQVNHRQPGNPQKLAEAIIQLSQTPVPPLRLPLGSDTVAALREKNNNVNDELARWEDLARSTDFTR
ncbi:SDR family NAD(P)-dependent oxidoreductase [Enterobacter sp. Ap-1006]|uniref:oxidoreductase n=1 Tax=Enterobacter sp. Ap-1006 TaxID=2608345 RepID=UPI001420E7F0|nr:oxidoreductase [Enterobacter sp. Ap-1006]NIF47379.1 SDR family NAD(P)-dependent oxidoreductase [Enterobacter sp. Ap-1006]